MKILYLFAFLSFVHFVLGGYNFGLGSCHSNSNNVKNVARIYQTPNYNPKKPEYTNWKVVFGEITETKVCLKVICKNGASECPPVYFKTCENSSEEQCNYARTFQPKNFYILARADGICA